MRESLSIVPQLLQHTKVDDERTEIFVCLKIGYGHDNRKAVQKKRQKNEALRNGANGKNYNNYNSLKLVALGTSAVRFGISVKFICPQK